MEDMLVPDLRSENIVAPANLPPPEVGVNPQHQYWPLPPAGQTYWWTYLWSDGNYYPCTGPLPAGVVGLAAQNLNDGAFRSNRVGYEKLISLSFFKAIDCTYWFPGQAEILRWYARGYRSWQNGQDLVANILSFRGHSRWCVDRGGQTGFDRGTRTETSINGRYTVASCTDPNTNVTYPSPPLVSGTRYGLSFANGSPSYANVMPPYPIVPDRPLNLDVTATTTYRTTANGEQGWRDARDCNPSGEPCLGTDQGITWFVSWKEVPGYTYAGKKVQYAGFSETGLRNDAIGPCEEWWFAEDIGPIYVIIYPFSTLAQAKTLLYGTSVYPNQSLDQTPEAHMRRRQNSMVGSLFLTASCLDNSCRVRY